MDAMVTCVACSRSKRKPAAKALQCLHTSRIIPVLCEFVQKLHPDAEAETVHQDTFLYRGCFRKLEKLVKLRSKVGNLESELETNLKIAVQQRGLKKTMHPSCGCDALHMRKTAHS